MRQYEEGERGYRIGVDTGSPEQANYHFTRPGRANFDRRVRCDVDGFPQENRGAGSLNAGRARNLIEVPILENIMNGSL